MESSYLDRDLSWLSFNHRVLQEAQNEQVPLYERIKFLAIYSSNLDEFFRVRVASLRSFKELRKKTRQALNIKPKKTLREIRAIVDRQQAEFGRIFREEILPELGRQDIFLIPESEYDAGQQAFARQYFREKVAPALHLIRAQTDQQPPFLRNKALYFAIGSGDRQELQLLEIPSDELPRFVVLPSAGQGHYVSFLDDLIRFNLEEFLPDRPRPEAYSIKLSRDAEMYIDDEFSGNLVEKIRQGLSERNIGLPTRFLYDSAMPAELLQQLVELFQLSKNDLIPGARYHNFNDFFTFPNPSGKVELYDPPMPPLPHPELEEAASLLTAIEEGDRILHFPYQKYDYVPKLLWEAAEDETVESIKITLYRVASKSLVTEALLHALSRGKRVVAFIEAKARFDEASNLFWGQRLQEAGAKVLYSYPGIKVHTKLFLITRREGEKPRRYAYLGTGNFNEKTARLYGDHALLTCDKRLTTEVAQVFQLLEGRIILPRCKHLLVSPFALRSGFTALIDREIKHARAGRQAYLILKMNSLEDPGMIDKLYEAAQAGVKVRLIIRGICCLLAGIPDWSEGIEATSIVDRFLEHARIYLFGNGGQEEMYLASADWMTRNLDRRVEVAMPIYDRKIFGELRELLDFQLNDNVKARLLHGRQENRYVQADDEAAPLRAQSATYEWLRSKG